MDARTRAWLDQERAWLKDTIRLHGFAIQYIGGGVCSHPGCKGGDDREPPFGYTVGLFGIGHAELIVVGLDQETTGAILNSLGWIVQDG